jgi:hypothetical protein
MLTLLYIRRNADYLYSILHARTYTIFVELNRGHRLAPWRSPYLRWRMETYSGLKMDKIGFVEISEIKERFPRSRTKA